MTQTTVAYSARNQKIESSVNGSSWTDISGYSNTIEVDGGERETEGTSTFDGDTMIQTAGKRGLLNVKVKIVYTEGVSDPVEVARAAYEAGTPYYLRWSPRGGGSNTFMFTSAAGVLKKPVLPAGDSKSAEAILVELDLETPNVVKSVIT